MGENGYRFGDMDDYVSDVRDISAARELSEQIDGMLAGQAVDVTDGLLAVAERLSRLSDLLPAVDPAFERRVMAPLQRPRSHALAARLPAIRFRAVSLAATAVLAIAVFLFTVPGQTALARLAAIFHLDTVEVGINAATTTPTEGRQIVSPGIVRSLGSLERAQQVAPVPLHVPTDLSADWSLADVTAVYYPDLPANVPLNIVLTYETRFGASLEVVEYFIRLGDNLTVDSLSRIDETSTSAREISIDGRRAILIESSGLKDVHTLIWQQDGVLLEVEALNLGLEDLLAIAASVRPVNSEQ